MRADRNATRERILAAAGRLFAEQGYHGTGVDQLCKEVGLGKGALYYHLDSKEQVLFELCRRNVAELIQQANVLESHDLPARVRLQAMTRVLMRNIADHQQEWQVFFHNFEALTGTRAQTVRRLRDRFEELVGSMIGQCVTEGVFRSVHPIVVKGVLGFFNYAYLWYRQDGALSPEEIADIFFDALANGLAAPAVAAPEPSPRNVGPPNVGPRNVGSPNPRSENES
ncbi:MAG TPA: TetR/AcrR family transcriptional regulator [Jatrophihabitans sp.]|nr:TetR/AcrR family transcriptional regulator [Jatrophihabitans sp.]